MKTAVLAGLLLALPAAAADLSPGRWPAEERARLEAAEVPFAPPAAREVRGSPVLVTGTASPIAVHAGIVALRQGGTAADAAAVVALTQVVRNLGATTSYAGKFGLIYFEARTRRVYSLDGAWAGYEAETDPGSIPDADLSSLMGRPKPGEPGAGLGRQTLVPGFMSGIETMHRRFGRLPFADLFQPAIWYAETGIRLSPSWAGYLRQQQPVFARTDAGRRFATMPDGAIPKAGDIFRQPDLAETLKGVAAGGAAYMATGPWAREYVEAVRAQGGKVARDDLARHRARWRPTISTRFAGAEVFAMSGGTIPCWILTALNLASAAGVERMGPYWRDPAAFKAYARAIRYGIYAPGFGEFERAKGFADARCEDRLEAPYAQAVAPEILRGAPVRARDRASAGHHTQAVVAVDRWGNVAVLVHSSNGSSTGIVVGGVPLSNAGAISKPALTQLKPGEPLPNDLAPIIALRRGKPVLAIGAVGSSLAQETFRLAGELLSGHADLATAMNAPPLLMNFIPPGPGQTFWSWAEVVPAGAYDADMLKALAADGVPTQQEPPMRVLGLLRGTAVAVVIDPRSGATHAVESPPLDNRAEAP